MLKAPVPGLFGLIGKTAPRQLSHLEMIPYALTTDSLSRAGLIGTVAVLSIFLL